MTTMYPDLYPDQITGKQHRDTVGKQPGNVRIRPDTEFPPYTHRETVS